MKRGRKSDEGRGEFGRRGRKKKARKSTEWATEEPTIEEERRNGERTRKRKANTEAGRGTKARDFKWAGERRREIGKESGEGRGREIERTLSTTIAG